MNRFLKSYFYLVLIFSLLLSQALFAKGKTSLDESFSHAVDLLTQLTLPNSMSQNAVESKQRQKKLEADWKQTTQVFYNNEGVHYLNQKMKSQNITEDSMPVLTGLKILFESKQKEAKEIILAYRQSSDSVVKQWADDFYKQLMKK